jgi:transposase-like protein
VGFKTKVALEAIKEHSPIAELVSKFQINRIQIQNWKKVAIEGLSSVFASSSKAGHSEKEQLIHDLYREIEKLKVENEFLKKNLILSLDQKRKCIE